MRAAGEPALPAGAAPGPGRPKALIRGPTAWHSQCSHEAQHVETRRQCCQPLLSLSGASCLGQPALILLGIGTPGNRRAEACPQGAATGLLVPQPSGAAGQGSWSGPAVLMPGPLGMLTQSPPSPVPLWSPQKYLPAGESSLLRVVLYLI